MEMQEHTKHIFVTATTTPPPTTTTIVEVRFNTQVKDYHRIRTGKSKNYSD